MFIEPNAIKRLLEEPWIKYHFKKIIPPIEVSEIVFMFSHALNSTAKIVASDIFPNRFLLHFIYNQTVCVCLKDAMTIQGCDGLTRSVVMDTIWI